MAERQVVIAESNVNKAALEAGVAAEVWTSYRQTIKYSWTVRITALQTTQVTEGNYSPLAYTAPIPKNNYTVKNV